MSDSILGGERIELTPEQRRSLTVNAARIQAFSRNGYEAEIERLCSALREIASADLKRCSAGWLRDIAVKALQSHEKSLGSSVDLEASEAP